MVNNNAGMNLTPEQAELFKKLVAKAEASKAKREESYQVRKLRRSTYQAYFEKHATEQEKKSLENAISAL
jgi:hypothetical protein